MGYTTTFEGKFTLDRLPPAEVIVKLRSLEDAEDLEYSPGGYCQWCLTKDCMSIEWDGGEKFYKYVPWLQWIIDRVLAPAGLTLSGTIAYSGEDVTDSGTIEVKDGKVIKTEAKAISDEAEELRRFRDFALASDWGHELLREWKRSKARRV